MIPNNNKTSLLIPSQLPQFIRDDPSYANFVAFIQAYYEWLEQNNNITDRTKNLLNYDDIDSTTSDFINYFCNDFLSYFPDQSTWATTNKAEVVKIAKTLYQSKGTPKAFKFLFRVLYNTDVDFFFTKDAVLRASAGKWYVAKSLKLSSLDNNFLKINNLRLFGETTKSIATIENAVISGNKTEVFISNIERLFQSGEFVRVVDSNNQDVLFNGQQLRAKIVGQISQVVLSKDSMGTVFGGQKYQANDPVVIYGGINPNTANPIIATASVGQTTLGSVQRISVETGGYGYSDNNTANVDFTSISISGGGNAIAHVAGLNPNANGVAHVTLLPTDYIGLKTAVQIGDPTHLFNYGFANNTFNNYNSTLANTFTFTQFDTFPISSVIVDNAGAGVSGTPLVEAHSFYKTEYATYNADLANIGILAPIQIANGGNGYVVNDKINIIGGSGYGAYANVTAVSANGSITSVNYVYNSTASPHKYSLGGMGYRLTNLPTLSITSANTNASNASLYVPGILGQGAVFNPLTNQVGVIQTINVTNQGEDYISAPKVSLKVQDILVTGIDVTNIPQNGDVLYQGSTFNNSTYNATVYSNKLITQYSNPLQSIYILRVYNYNQPIVNFNLPLKNDTKGISLNLSTGYVFPDDRYQPLVTPGVLTYGDGNAQATASFLNGLVVSQGTYLDTTGQPSSFDVLQSLDYNNFTYEITLEKEIAKYRNTLLNLLHPTGMKVSGRYLMKSNNYASSSATDTLNMGYSLYYYTGVASSTAEMRGSFTNPSNNIIHFTNLSGANLENIILNNTSISFTTTDGQYVQSKVLSVLDDASNTAVIRDNVWL